MRAQRTILFVAPPYVIHTRRWISQLKDSEISASIIDNEGPMRIAEAIRETRPDLIHSFDLVGWGVSVARAKDLFLPGEFPPWIVTDWGNSLNFFSKFPENRRDTRKVLKSCDYFWSESERDNRLARKWGFRGKILPTVPMAGGFDLERLLPWREKIPLSRRKWILVKGYQTRRGRALCALRALERCSELLKGYKIGIYGSPNQPPSAPLIPAAKRFEKRTGIPALILRSASHEQQLRRHARARISIGLCMSDGISNSFLDALLMGSYPIQSDTSCAGEWIRNGTGGSIVPPEAIRKIEKALRLALTDDKRIEKAARVNLKAIRRADAGRVRAVVLRTYREALRSC